jgi:uncharacterized protein with von Willebrand factor type A (vWA) domain
MPIYRFGSRYSRWDGTQQIGPLSADELMQAMSDDLMQDGDVNRALQRLFRWGFQRPDGEHVPGLQALLQRLRDKRQEQLQRYNLQSMLSDIAERIQQIVGTEREGIAQRLENARRQQGAAEPASTDAGDEASRSGESSADNSLTQAGQDRAAASGQPGADSGGADPDLLKLLEAMAQRRLEELDALPPDPPGAIRSLLDYDFMTPEARQQFQELLDMLQQQVMQQTSRACSRPWRR